MKITVHTFTDDTAAVVHRFADGSGGAMECTDAADLAERVAHLEAMAADAGEAVEIEHL